MPNVNITPQTVLLTSGRSVTFEATDAKGLPIAVSWSLNPAQDSGSLVSPAAGTQATSASYVAPSPVGPSAKTIAIVASTASDSASATISLTPIAIVPAKVDLKAGEEQRFLASIEESSSSASTPPESLTWVLSPQLGTLDEKTGLYTAPNDIQESATVQVIATTPSLGKQGMAVINLMSAPWQGVGANILGGYLLLVFSLVFLLIGLWPPALPSPELAKSNRIEAEQTLESAKDKQKADRAAEKAAAVPDKTKGVENDSQKNTEGNKKGAEKSDTPPVAPETKTDGDATNSESAGSSTAGAGDVLKQVDEARTDLKRKQEIEKEVNDTDVHTKLIPSINRELDLLWLVLLAGTLGSFLHTAQSYSEYVGNRTLKVSWAWWYSFRPFIGAGLALVFYAAIRGGFMAIATGSSAKASELNPFGVVSVAAMVGMFSKAATVKLGEVFDTVFKSDKAKESKDPVAGNPQTPTQPANKPAAGAGGTATGTK